MDESYYNMINFKKVIKLLALICVSAIILFFANPDYLYSGNNSNILICIDPGHGGRDPGAIGPTGLTEKSVNLDIALRLKDKLRNAGYSVIMTRESDVYKSLAERVDIANNSGANVFISVHNNAFTLPTPNGTETYYSTSSPGLSRNLAIYVNSETIKQINTYNRGVKTADFYVLKNTHMISSLIEGVFISNPAEESKLRDANFRDSMAKGIYNGIVRFLENNEIASFDAAIDDNGNTPEYMNMSEQKVINVKVKNNSSNFTWPSTGSNRVNISYHIYDKYGKTVVFDGIRSTIVSNIGPGETRTVPVTISAPANAGNYVIEYDVVQEGVTWFGEKGSTTLKRNIRVVDPDCIRDFITNLYEELILVQPEQTALDDWEEKLVNKTNTAGDIITGLMAAGEFYDRDLDNEGFVTTLYRALFDREPDTGGFEYWTTRLSNGMTRQALLTYFVRSAEFGRICTAIGIDRGSAVFNDDNTIVITTISNSTSIIGRASAAREQLVQLFTDRNSTQTARAQRLADLYIKWGNTFNIRYDIAWAQMCHETGFLGYTGIVPPNANNFCGLGATGQKDANGNYVYNTFSSEELGVIAHYIHLAWYATPNCLTLRDSNGDLYCSTKYDPRHFGTGHNYNGNGNLGCLNTRWAPSSTYTGKIIQFANEIYE